VFQQVLPPAVLYFCFAAHHISTRPVYGDFAFPITSTAWKGLPSSVREDDFTARSRAVSAATRSPDSEHGDMVIGIIGPRKKAIQKGRRSKPIPPWLKARPI
jgi:hypothetical protein